MFELMTQKLEASNLAAPDVIGAELKRLGLVRVPRKSLGQKIVNLAGDAEV